jgi:hypothetical protein
MSNVINYTEQGGEKTVIGGTLEIKEGASVTGLPSPVLPVATEAVLGGIKSAEKSETYTVEVRIGEDGKLYVPTYPVETEVPVAANQPNSAASDVPGLLADFNALLSKLIAAGLMAAE